MTSPPRGPLPIRSPFTRPLARRRRSCRRPRCRRPPAPVASPASGDGTMWSAAVHPNGARFVYGRPLGGRPRRRRPACRTRAPPRRRRRRRLPSGSAGWSWRGMRQSLPLMRGRRAGGGCARPSLLALRACRVRERVRCGRFLRFGAGGATVAPVCVLFVVCAAWYRLRCTPLWRAVAAAPLAIGRASDCSLCVVSLLASNLFCPTLFLFPLCCSS